MGKIVKNGIDYTGGGGSEYTAGNGIKIENDVISGTKVDASKGATNIIEVESYNSSKLGFEFGEDITLMASSPMMFGENRTLQEKLTAGDNITIENNTISADDEVLVAVYEQTSYADVKAAIDAHKAIVLDMPANNNQFCITFSTYTNGGNALMYAIYKMNDKPTLMAVTLTPQNQWSVSHTDLQDKLVSGTNIKTINNQSLLGSGNIDIQGGGGTFYADGYGFTFETDPVHTGSVDVLNIGPDASSKCMQFNYYIEGGEDFHYTPTTEFTGELSDLVTTDKTNLVGAINEVYEKSGEPFRVKQWAANNLDVAIPYCTEDISNTSIPKLTYTIDDTEGADYQIVGMIAYEVFDAASGGNRINCWPVCQFTGNGQKELNVRMMCGGTTRKTAKRISAWVLLKHR